MRQDCAGGRSVFLYLVGENKMADNTQEKSSPNDADIELDPIIQGADRVRANEDEEAHLNTAGEDDTQDTQTRANIHLGGRTAEGETLPEQEDGGMAVASVENTVSTTSPVHDTLEEAEARLAALLQEDAEEAADVVTEEPLLTGATATSALDFEQNTTTTQTAQPTSAFLAQDSEITETQTTTQSQTSALPPEEETAEPAEPENTAPVAGNIDLGATLEDTSVTFTAADLLANSTDVDGDSLSVTAVSVDPAYGTVSDNGDGTYSFTPTENYNGDDVPLSFTVSDGVDSAQATASLDVTALNDGPTVSGPTGFAGTEDTGIVFSETDLLANASDVDGDTLSVANLTSDSGSLNDNGDGTWTLTPDADFNGTVNLNYDVSDGTTTTAASGAIDVAAVNDGPVATADGFAGTEDQAISGNVLTNDTDVDGDVLSVVAETITTAQGGTVTIAADGSFDYSPAADFNGEDSFSYTLSDGTTTDSGSVTLTVAAENDGPIAGNIDLGATLEDTSVTFTAADLLANSTDVDGDSLSVTAVSVDPAYGTVADNGDGTYSFTPAENYSGDDVPLSFTVSDGVETSQATASLDVTAVADGPSLGVSKTLENTDGQYDISGGGEITIDASYLSVEAGYNSSHGYYVADADGNPIGGAIIQDNVKDADSHSITINPDDYPGGVTLGFFIIPDGHDANASMTDGSAVTFEQIDGVWTPMQEGAPLSGQGAPAYFSNQALNPDGYDHLADTVREGNQNWEDLYGGGDKDHTDVNTQIEVRQTTDVTETVQGNEENAIALPDITASLNDVDGSESLSLVISQVPEGTVLQDSAGHSFTATADTGSVDVTGWTLEDLTVTPAEGTVDFDLQVTATSTEDSNGDSATTTSIISVDVNNGPDAVADTASAGENQAITVDVLANDTDINGDTLSLTDVVVPSGQGGVSIVDGQVQFDPGSDFDDLKAGETQDVVVTYEASDGQGGSVESTLTITVTGSNDGPVAEADVAMTGEDSSVTLNVLANDTDVEGDSLSVTSASVSSGQGAVTINDDGTLSYDPGESYAGLDDGESATVEISYTVSDGQGGTDSATATVTVTGSNDGPVVGTVDLGATLEDTSMTFTAADLLSNSTDVDGDSLSVTAVSVDPAYGTVSDNGDGTYSFTPTENYSGDNVPLNFTVSDGVDSGQATASIDVTAVVDGVMLHAGSTTTTTTDSGFEDAVITEGTQTGTSGFYMADSLGDWHTDSGAFEVWSEEQTSQAYTASEGGQYLELNKDTTGTYADTMNIYQDIQTQEGHDYSFSFDFSARPGYDEDVSKVEVWINGEKVEEISDSGIGATDTNWSNHEYSFTGDGSSVRVEIKYAGEGAQYGRGAYIDNLTVTDVEDVEWAASGTEGLAIALPEIISSLVDTDGSETMALSISAIPEGAVLSDGAGNSFTASTGDTAIDVSDWALDSMTITPAEGTTDFDLQVAATVTETSTGDSVTTSHALAVHVESDAPGADPVDHDAAPAVPEGYTVTTGTEAGDALQGSDGVNDYIDGAGGADHIVAGSGDDIVYGGSGGDALNGDAGNDTLYGGAGDDALYGGDQNDILVGGSGNDALYGQLHDDTFVFGANEGADTVDGGAGWTDTIQLDGYDGAGSQQGWTLTLDDGSTITSTDEEAHEMMLSEDASGTITFDSGGTIDFDNIEKIVW
ncbi:hypothetical protein CRD36_18025 [Paremcibacter congregatus]|uniref:Cadherin domain-containing protein n=2 Tax=Paremcibacter congregatus TaxID=2043170 RepID=A0A2G4YPR9_9PROT|nr:hypothetical protein CRD36_18025 [Paremcibacter congregatus]